MLKFLTYKTPSKFFTEFDNYYSYANLRQVKIISTIIFAISCCMRLCSFIFYEEIVQWQHYAELSFSNWTQFFGSLAFFVACIYALKPKKVSKKERKGIVVLFIIYMLTMSFSVSYIMSLHNAKNMLTMFLIGITTVSLFFAIELRVVIFAVLYIILIYLIALVLPNLSIQEKIINCMAAVILGVTLFAFSRYSYYFKSKHFVKIKELEEKNQEILYLNAQKGEILSFVAHDLRAPLNNIEALSNLMLIENEHNNEAKMIVSAASQAKNIINDLIEAAKQDHHTLPTEPISMNVFVNNIANKWQTNTQRKIRLFINEEDIIIKANPSKLERVIDNLISNAFKFSSIYTPIDITITQKDSKAIITVADFGIGIPQHLQAHIFEQFSIAGRQGLNGEKSIGLGLHISHKIIEQHSGKLLVESKENEGTTFTIQLPLASA